MSKEPFTPFDYIPKPCKEDWHQMTGNEKRRHCEKCDTHVVDLTGMSEDEIFELREKNGGELCGVFRLSSSLAKPLAIGTGIASLALAACETKREVVVPGVICPPPAKNEPVKKKHVAPPSKKLPVPILRGEICAPPPQPRSGPV